jgi:hypothetical protein
LCPSSGWSGIALHQEEDFFARRMEILAECTRLQPRDPPMNLNQGSSCRAPAGRGTILNQRRPS